ncbi:MAG: hypothetical protein WBA45_17085 [Microthrixaceae bacterium]
MTGDSLSQAIYRVPALLSGSGILAIGGDDADTQLSMVIGALVGLAVVILIVTVIYWRVTRPTQDRSASIRRSARSGDPQD